MYWPVNYSILNHAPIFFNDICCPSFSIKNTSWKSLQWKMVKSSNNINVRCDVYSAVWCRFGNVIIVLLTLQMFDSESVTDWIVLYRYFRMHACHADKINFYDSIIHLITDWSSNLKGNKGLICCILFLASVILIQVVAVEFTQRPGKPVKVVYDEHFCSIPWASTLVQTTSIIVNRLIGYVQPPVKALRNLNLLQFVHKN